MQHTQFAKRSIIIVAIVCCLIYTGNSGFNTTANANHFPAERPLPEVIDESYECLEGTAASNSIVKALEWAGEFIKQKAIDTITVSDSEQNRYGDEYVTEMKKSGELKIDEKNPLTQKLRTILNRLLEKRTDASGIRYEIFLLDDTSTVNAYTFGGKIFVTKAIIKKAKNDDQLYAIVGHEIGHNEKKHIKSTLQQIKASEKYFGKYKDLAFKVKQSMSSVFNQKSELEADYYGLKLSYTLGYAPCSFVQFWDEMSKNEGGYSKLEDFMRSHPYSATRSKCLKAHIADNYKEACK